LKKTILVLSTLLLTVAIAAGCGQKSADPQPGDQTEVVQPAEQTLKIQSFYTDDQILNLVPKDTEIKFSDAKAKYLAALKTLQQTDDEKLIALWDKSEFLSATLKDDGALTVDVKIPEDAHLGASGEDLALQALLKTSFQFDEVKTVDILVDGKSVDSLMGHVELEHPFSRN